MRTPPIAFAIGVLSCCCAGALRAQANPQWQPIGGLPGPRGAVYDAAWWDPDGPGPAGLVLVSVGPFQIGPLDAGGIAMFDPVSGTWSAFADQPNASVSTVAVMPSGELVIGGSFTAIGQQSAPGIALFDGTNWSSPGGGVTGPFFAGARAVRALPNGDLVVGGTFAFAGPITAIGLARWDGNQWHPLGGFSGIVQAIDRRPNGNLVVVGSFTVPGSSSVNIGEWDGSSWTTLGSGLGTNIDIADDVHILANGDLIATGPFTVAGGVPVNNTALWRGGGWQAIPALVGAPRAFLNLPNGELLAASLIRVNGVPVDGVVRFDGSAWTRHAPNIGQLYALTTMPGGDLVGLGAPTDPGGRAFRGAARFDGSTWHALANGFDDEVHGLAALANGETLAYGNFWSANGIEARWMARWNGASWSPWQGPLPTCTAVDPHGDFWIGSQATLTPGPGVVFRWSAGGWQPIGSAIAHVTSLDVTDPLQPIVGTASPGLIYGKTVAQWNGQQWNALGAQVDGPVRVMLRHSSGDLIVGGEFLFSGATGVSRIARWDGTTWHPLGAGLDGPVLALTELPNGDLVAGGHFFRDGTGVQPLHLVARWDGNAWHALQTGLTGGTLARVNQLLALPNGDVLAAGEFTTAGGAPAANIARWSGTAWSAVDGGVDGEVLALAMTAASTVVAGGRFLSAGGQDSAHFAPLATDLPATAVGFGSGCSGLGGQLALATDALPWAGGTYRSTCYGVSTTGIAVDFFGLQATQTPLSAVHPGAGPGCLLLATPDLATLRLPALGIVRAALAIPNSPSLSGALLFQQVVVGEFAGLTPTMLASSNGVRLTIGAF